MGLASEFLAVSDGLRYPVWIEADVPGQDDDLVMPPSRGYHLFVDMSTTAFVHCSLFLQRKQETQRRKKAAQNDNGTMAALRRTIDLDLAT